MFAVGGNALATNYLAMNLWRSCLGGNQALEETVSVLGGEAYSEACQISKMERFAKIVNRF